MSDERSRRLRELFSQACDLDATDVGPFVEAACGSDDDLKRELTELLALDDDSHAVLAESVVARGLLSEQSPPRTEDAPAGEVVGSFRLVSLLGAGGMGCVYRAERLDTGEVVALKMLRAGAISRESLRRFRHEARILAQLHHPGIATLYDVGHETTADSARPYFAMELVDGVPLTQFLRQRDPTLRQRVELLADLAEAVDHAHQQSIIHRDLKPANVLVTPSGQVKILDFGVARTDRLEHSLSTLHTSAGQLLGTLPYMSPEQVAGSALLDHRTDVYSLGVLTFEALSGQLPYDLAGASIPEAARIIREVDPPRLTRIQSGTPVELQTIVECALAKEPRLRYHTAADLARDLRRYLDGHRIHARPMNTIRQLRRFVGRHRALTVATVTIVLSLSAALGISLWKTGEVTDALTREESHRQRAERQAERASRESYRATWIAASAALEADLPVEARRLLERTDPARRGWEWEHLWAQLDESIAKLEDTNPLAFRLSPEGDELWTITSDGQLVVRAIPSMQVERTVHLGGHSVTQAAFSRDGRSAAIALGPENQSRIEVWSTSGTCLHTSPLTTSHVRSLTIDAGGRHVAWLRVPDSSPSEERTQALHHWDVDSSRPPEAIDTHPCRFTAHSRIAVSGQWLVANGQYGQVRMLHLASKRQRRGRLQPAFVTRCIAVTANGDRFAIAGADHAIHVFTMSPSAPSPNAPVMTLPLGDHLIHTLRGHSGDIRDLRFGPDGETLFSVAEDGVVAEWDLRQGTCRGRHLSRTTGLTLVEVSQDGRFLAASDRQGQLFVWDRSYTPVTTHRGEASYLYAIQSSSSGDELITVGNSGSFDVHSLDTLAPPDRIQSHKIAYSVAWSPNGRKLARGGEAGRLLVVDRHDGEVNVCFDGKPMTAGRVLALEFIDDQRLLVGCGPRGKEEADRTYLFDCEHGEVAMSFATPSPVSDLALFPDRRTAAAALRDGSWVRLDLTTGRLQHQTTISTSQLTSIDVEPSGTWVVMGDADGRLFRSDASSGAPFAHLATLPATIWAVACTSDGDRVAVACDDGAIRLINPHTGQEIGELRGHQDYVHDLDFTPDGRVLLSCSGDGTVRTWDTRPRREPYLRWSQAFGH